MSMIPTQDRAPAAAVGLGLLPELKGPKIRRPSRSGCRRIQTFSLVDLSFTAARKTSVEEIHGAGQGGGPGRARLSGESSPYQRRNAVCRWISITILRHPTYDAHSDQVIEGTMVKGLFVVTTMSGDFSKPPCSIPRWLGREAP